MGARAAVGISEPAPSRPAAIGRLRSKADFSRVFERPDRVLHGRFFRVLMRDTGQGALRLGTAIARKHTRTAVRRNLAKRLVRETLRQEAAHLPPVDVVVLSRPGVRGAERRELRDDLIALWRRLRVR